MDIPVAEDDFSRNLLGSAVWSDGLDSRGTTDSQLEHRDVSAHQRRIQQQQQQQQQQMLVSDSKTSSGDRRSAAVQRLVDLQHQSKHLSRLLAAKREDFDMKMENLQQRREQLQSAELRLKRSILDNDKSILDNEARRTRALKKAKDTQEMCKVRDKEIERLRSELTQLEQHRARLSDRLSKQSVYEEFLTQVMSASSEFIDIRSIMSRYHTLKQLYEDLNEKQLRNEELLKNHKSLLYEMIESNNTRVLRHNTDLAELHARLDHAHTRVVDAEASLVRLDAELATKTIMFGNIVTVTTNIYRMVENNAKKSMRPLRGKKMSDPIQQLATVHTFLTNLQELLKGADELGYRRRVFQKSSTTISLI